MRHPIAAAESVFRRLGGFPEGADRPPATADLLTVVARFAEVDFDVAGEDDGDGFLFQYLTLRTAPGFVAGFARQFAVPGPPGDDVALVQLLCEYHLDPDPELAAAGHLERWWFRSGPEPFDTWFTQVTADPVWGLVDARSPAFVIRQEEI